MSGVEDIADHLLRHDHKFVILVRRPFWRLWKPVYRIRCWACKQRLKDS